MPSDTVKRTLDHRTHQKQCESSLLIQPATTRRKRGTAHPASALALLIVCELLLFAQPTGANAQALLARISVLSVAPAKVSIDVELPAATDSLSFRNTYGDAVGLGDRIAMLEAVKGQGSSLIQAIAPGEFRTGEKFAHFRYQVGLTEPSRATQRSRVSWLNNDQGLLMMADLLPVASKDHASFSSVRITVDVPQGWTVASNAERDGVHFKTDDPDNAVFLLGPAVREKSEGQDASGLSIIRAGQWPFAHKDALKIGRRILGEYSRLTGFGLRRKAVVMLVPFPGETGPDVWSAETRGNVVVLLLGRKASGRKVLARLAIVLSHELFHLWVPNSLRLVGDYDWFFEGFTLYQALLTDLRLGFISFSDYLDTMAKVYEAYLSAPDRNRWSLLEASQRRWTISSRLIYEKGMLVAFVYDLLLRSRTNCQESMADIYARLFRLPTTGQENANETIIKLLTQGAGSELFAKSYVESRGEIQLDHLLSEYGIKVRRSGSESQWVIGDEQNKAQERLLGCLGYRH
jgi:hypothetical protein